MLRKRFVKSVTKTAKMVMIVPAERLLSPEARKELYPVLVTIYSLSGESKL